MGGMFDRDRVGPGDLTLGIPVEKGHVFFQVVQDSYYPINRQIQPLCDVRGITVIAEPMLIK